MGNPFYNNFNSAPDAEAQMIFFSGFFFIWFCFYFADFCWCHRVKGKCSSFVFIFAWLCEKL